MTPDGATGPFFAAQGYFRPNLGLSQLFTARVRTAAAPNAYHMPPRATVIASPFTPPAAASEQAQIRSSASPKPRALGQNVAWLTLRDVLPRVCVLLAQPCVPPAQPCVPPAQPWALLAQPCVPPAQPWALLARPCVLPAQPWVL